MTARTVRHLGTTVGICLAAASAAAHHSHPIFYDACRTVTITGRVLSAEWKDPHTLVVVRTDDGAAYTVDWNSLSGLTHNGILAAARAALVPEARVTVTGHPIRSSAEIRTFSPEYRYEVNPRTIDPTLIRRVDAGWNWSRAVQNSPDCKNK